MARSSRGNIPPRCPRTLYKTWFCSVTSSSQIKERIRCDFRHFSLEMCTIKTMQYLFLLNQIKSIQFNSNQIKSIKIKSDQIQFHSLTEHFLASKLSKILTSTYTSNPTPNKLLNSIDWLLMFIFLQPFHS